MQVNKVKPGEIVRKGSRLVGGQVWILPCPLIYILELQGHFLKLMWNMLKDKS